jgi:hypothetical protein
MEILRALLLGVFMVIGSTAVYITSIPRSVAHTSGNEWARFGKRDRGFDNSQSSLLGNGGDFSYFGIRNYPVPIATYTVAKFLGRMALLRC